MKKIFLVVFSLVLVLGITGCSNNSEPDNANQKEGEEQPTEKKEEKTKEFYFDGETVEIEDLRIKITKTMIIQPGDEGNSYGDVPVFAIWYETTNKTDKDINPTTAWFAVFNAYQDNNPNFENKLSVGSLPDSNHRDTQMFNIKKDGTLENSIAYELSDETTPVTLVATKGILGDEIGRFDFKIAD